MLFEILLFRKSTHLVSLGEWFLAVKGAKVQFLAVLPGSARPSTKLSERKGFLLQVVRGSLVGNLTWYEHVTHTVKKGSKRL